MIANVERVAEPVRDQDGLRDAASRSRSASPGWPYPFLPRHLTIISSLTIGIPAFFLALAPNRHGSGPASSRACSASRSRPGTIVAISTFVAYWLARDRQHLSLLTPRRRPRSCSSPSGCTSSRCSRARSLRAALALVASDDRRRRAALRAPDDPAISTPSVCRRGVRCLRRGHRRIACVALEGWWTIDQRSRPPDERIAPPRSRHRTPRRPRVDRGCSAV